jgi:murein DD-endopeptidase MepM/ murein hydrolase activator NlpD
MTGQEDVSIEREKLENQRAKIEKLSQQLENQERYINSIRLILLGEVPINSDMDSLNEVSSVKLDSILTDQTESEKVLADKVKDDIRTNKDSNPLLNYFSSPVTGVISQKYNKKTHPGIDVVTEKDKAVKACLAGTVIYSGYTRKDGHILIIDHANGFISVYKHNKTVLKKLGAKVKMGDPVSIVGNTGENTDGPHLHFELWHNQVPVNPSDYIRFTK